MKGTDGWKKTKTLIIVLLVLFLNIIPLFNISTLNASTIYVQSIDSLQDKINQSSDGDIIQINSSISLNNYTIINKSITIQGKTGELIVIDGSGYGLNITTNNISIKNLTIINCSQALYISNQTSILENITIYGVSIQNCSNYGINIKNTTLSSIQYSNITHSQTTAISLYNTTNTSIYTNTIKNCSNTGLSIKSNSNNNSIYNNTLNNNTVSINITSSSFNLIYNNSFTNCSNIHAYDDSINSYNTTTHGNYWDDYNGTDINNDSLGDTNYTIIGNNNKDEKVLGFFAPLANFTFQPSTPTTANTISLTDNSTDPNNVNSPNLFYNWDFGDDSTSTQQNPSHSYEDDGIYTITLNVSNTYHQWNSTTRSVTISNLGPSLSFSWAPDPGILNESISFSGTGNDPDGSIDSWSWDFGDNNTSAQQNPTHTYIQTGDYTVVLNITDDDGNYSSESQTITITEQPVVDFTIEPSNPTTSDTITFTDNSTDDESIESYNWSFGDNSYSADENPTHSYDDDGEFTVTLNVTDNDGVANETSKTVTILNSNPTANFTYSPQNPTDMQTITFTDHSLDSDGNITNCTWSFGDGDTNYSLNTTTHKFEDNGTYTVSLNVTDDDGGSDEYTVNITVLNVGPTAKFTYEPLSPLVGETIWFNDTSSDQDGAIVNWSWDFDDDDQNTSQNTEHIYSKLNSYDVTLTVTDNDGNSSSITKHIILKKTITKSVSSSNKTTFDLTDDADVSIQLKTKSETNLSISTYSERPASVDKTITGFENQEKYIDITLENESLLEWINFSLYYTDKELDKDVEEKSLSLFYWNETNDKWIELSNCLINTNKKSSYSGFVQSNISHLTLFTLGGKEKEKYVPPTLPSILNSSNNKNFTIKNPILEITYERVIPSLSATLNGSTIPWESIDNKTFTFFINTDLSNGNYNLTIQISNGSLSRTDTIHFTVNIPTKSQTSNKPVSIPLWIWYSILFFIIGFCAWFFDGINIIKKILSKYLPNYQLDATKTKNNRPSQGILKDTIYTLQHAINSFDPLIMVFGSNDPWEHTKADINQTMFNIDLFTEKPDVYVGIQEKILTEEPTCKSIINLLKNDEKSLSTIKKKISLSSDELSKEISILIKYGLIYEQENHFQLTDQAKVILKEEKKGK